MDDNSYAGLIHLLGILGLGVVSIILWVIKKDESQFIDTHGKAFLNFYISFAIYMTVACILALVLIGIVLMIGLGIFAFIVGIIATVKAFNGEYYEYPLAINIIK